MTLLVPVSWGELLDKITILEIKTARMRDPAKLANVGKELEALRRVCQEGGGVSEDIRPLVDALREINGMLWEIEDDIRDCERNQDFGARFIALARAVYVTNDQRAAVKRQLNDRLGSELVEEKSYQDYSQTP